DDIDLAGAVGGVVAIQLHDGRRVVNGLVAGVAVDQADGAGGAGEVVDPGNGGHVAVEVAPGVADVGGQDMVLLAGGEVPGSGHVAHQAVGHAAGVGRRDVRLLHHRPGLGRGVHQHLAGRARAVDVIRAEDQAEVVLGGALGVVEGRHRGGQAQIVV